jgi:hypothetical protein
VRLVEAVRKRERDLFALANAISFSFSPILLNYLLIRYLDGHDIQEAIFTLTLINTIGLTLFLSVDLLVPRYLLDSDYSRPSIFLFSLRTNLIFATLTFFTIAIVLAFEEITSLNYFAIFLYIYSMAFLFSCRSFLGGSNQFSKAFYLTIFDFLSSLGLLAITVTIGKIYFWSILVSVAISRIVTCTLWFGFFYTKLRLVNREVIAKELIWSKELYKVMLNLVTVGAGLQILNNLPVLLISKSSMSNTYLIQIVVLIQIVRGLYGLLSGFASRSLNILNEINLKISGLTKKRVLLNNAKIIALAFFVLLAIFLWKGNYIMGIYTSNNVTFNIVIFALVLVNESLLYLFGILRLILISIGRVFLLNVVIGSTVLCLIVSWNFLNESNLGILYSVGISTLLGIGALYFFSFLNKKAPKN